MSARKFELFPKEFGKFAFVWLIYWTIPVFSILFYAPMNMRAWLGLLLLLSFLPVYRQTFWAKGAEKIPYIVAEIVIIAILALMFNPSMLYMGFYPAVVIGMLPNKKHMLWTLAGLTVVNLLVIYIDVGFNQSLLTEWFGLLVMLLSMCVTPFGVRSGIRRRELSEQLAQANSQIQRLTKIEERQRIARDLHDTLGHTLSMITLKSELAEKLIQRDPERAAKEIHDIQIASRSALSQVRELVVDMRTVDFQEELEGARQILAAANIKLQVKGELSEKLKEPTLRTTILAMCMREAITNVVRHSQASHCEIHLIEDASTIELAICDDGIGCRIGSADHEKAVKSGNGLFGMRQRLELVNGTLQIQCEPQKGTKLTISVPKVVTGKGAVR
jgi:two-component system, NarL family, sensor histidine kinase DesK